jgi:hypothetical protein
MILKIKANRIREIYTKFRRLTQSNPTSVLKIIKCKEIRVLIAIRKGTTAI